MDALDDERGQAAIFVVALLAIGAVAILGLGAAATRIVAASAERSAGEAAIEAATSVIADAYAAEMRARAADPARGARDVRTVIADPAVLLRAREVADALARWNGGGALDELAVTCERGMVTVEGTVRGTAVRAGFAGAQCLDR